MVLLLQLVVVGHVLHDRLGEAGDYCLAYRWVEFFPQAIVSGGGGRLARDRFRCTVVVPFRPAQRNVNDQTSAAHGGNHGQRVECVSGGTRGDGAGTGGELGPVRRSGREESAERESGRRQAAVSGAACGKWYRGKGLSTGLEDQFCGRCEYLCDGANWTIGYATGCVMASLSTGNGVHPSIVNEGWVGQRDVGRQDKRPQERSHGDRV